MKNLFLTALLLSGVVLHAQRGEHSEMQDLSAEQIATLQTKKMTLALDLNESQQQDIQKFNEEQARIRKEAIAARNKSGEDDERKEPNADERFNHQVERLDRAIEHKAKMKDILSEEQFEKWEKIQMKKGHHRRMKHKGNSPHHGKGKRRG